MNQTNCPSIFDGRHLTHQSQFNGYIKNIDELLTPGLAGTCRKITNHLQTPEPMALSMLVAFVSSVVMLRHLVESGPGRTGQTGISTMILAEINERKTEADRVLSQPLKTWTASAEKLIYKSKLKGLSAALVKATRDRKDCFEIEKQLSELVESSTEQPYCFRAEVRTGTIEGVIETIRQQGSVFWNASEGGAALDSDISQAAPILSDLWSAVPPAHVTKSNGLQSADYALFSAIIAVQPALLKKFLTTSKGRRWIDSGLISRFLIVYAESTQGFRDLSFSNTEPLDLTFYNYRIIELLNQARKEREKPLRIIGLSADALHRLQSFRLYIELELRPGGKFAGVKGAAGKMPENAARLAAVMHVYEGSSGEIEGETMRRAINLAEIYLHEHLRLFDVEVTPFRVEMTARSILRTIGRSLAVMGPSYGYNLKLLSNRGSDDVRDRQMRALALQWCVQNQSIYYGNMMGQQGTHIFLTPSGWTFAQQLLQTPDAPLL
jgi:Protein of unknown function (DUF3987)